MHAATLDKPADKEAWKQGKRRVDVYLDDDVAEGISALAYRRGERAKGKVIAEIVREYLAARRPA
jgi:metal-responsive CopG/Arc/MetJ family transcriptional regulator